MANTKELVKTLDDIILPSGYTRKKYTWYAPKVEAIQVVNLQKSDYSGQFFINFGIWLRALGVKEFPAEHHCHVRFRLGRIPGTDHDRIEKLLNLDDQSITNLQRTNGLKVPIDELALPYLNRCSSLAGLSELKRIGQLPPATMLVVNELLEKYLLDQEQAKG